MYINIRVWKSTKNLVSTKNLLIFSRKLNEDRANEYLPSNTKNENFTCLGIQKELKSIISQAPFIKFRIAIFYELGRLFEVW